MFIQGCKDLETPTTYEEIIEIIDEARSKGLKISPIGLGKHHIGRKNADICISMKNFDKILEVSKADLYVTVQAGVRVDELQKTIEKEGLFLPFTYSGTAGGLASTNYPSLFSLFYPYPKDYLLGAKIITGEGKIIRSGSKTTKFSSGYKIWKALSGSLGTLGIYVELTFRLVPKPEMISFVKVNNPLEYLSLRPWGILSRVEYGKIENYLIFAGFESYIKKIKSEYFSDLSEGLPSDELNCERVFGIVTTRGDEIEILKKYNQGIAYVGSGYVKVCDENALKLRNEGYTVVIEKGCKEGEDCFGYSYQAFKLLKQALDPNNVFAMVV